MNYLKSWSAAPGWTEVIGRGGLGLKRTEFGLLVLGPGETHAVGAGPVETVLVVLGGVCSVSGPGFAFEGVGSRQDVFSGKPHAVYVPARQAYAIRAHSALELAWTRAPSPRARAPVHIRPDDVGVVDIGAANYARRAFMIVGETFDSDNFIVGEALVPSGNWSSWPPHRHDVNRLPEEVDMEEFYFYRFAPKHGFGIQRLYTDDGRLDETLAIRYDDTVGIPEGYHPVVCAPGCTMYYLWAMAGDVRKFVSHKDPRHAAGPSR